MILAGSLLIGAASCGKADPNDYEYGQSINQVTEDENYIAGNGGGDDENGGGISIGGGDDENGGGDDENGGLGNLTGGKEVSDMDVWIDKLQARPTGVQYADTENKEFEEYIDKLFKESVTSDTLNYNYAIKDGSVYGVTAPSPATIGDAESYEYYAEVAKESHEEYDKLKSFEDKPLTEEEYFILIALEADYERALYNYDHIDFYEPFAPMRGFQSNIGTTLAEYRFDDKQDIEDFIAVENMIPEYVDKLCAFENERVEKGFGMQDNAIDDVVEQCNTFAEDKENHFLILEFDSKMDKLDFLTDEERAAYKEQNKQAVLESLIPAMLKIRDCVSANKGKATVSGGLAQYEGGKEYYNNYIIPHFGGCNFTGDDLIKIYEERYEACFNRMMELYMSNPDAYNYYVENSETLFAEADARSATENIDILMSTAMDEYPKLDKIPYKADYLSPAMEKIMEHTLAYYMSPAYDDPDGNIIRVNGAFSDDMWVTLAHEGCPGHMYQNTYYQATNPKPIRADAYCLGYLEGWAVYSSYRTMAEYDFKDTDDDAVIAEFAKLDKELGYMVYGRIDVGVNYEGWSEQDLADYMTENGYNAEYAGEIMLTVSGDPGVYLSYSFSQYMMEGFRTWSEHKLGDKFDPVEFHKAILDNGPCQFEVLKFKVDEYILENQ